jgi:phosphoribosylcarboxyaminoimidazole (NCAIR) mutase
MKRLPVYFSDDILMEEIISMAKAQGFHVRITCGMVVCDRVPGIVAKEAPDNVLAMPAQRRLK